MTVAAVGQAVSAARVQEAAGGGRPASKLEKSAQEFESILLQSWLEKTKHAFAGEQPSQDAGHDTLDSLASQALAGAMAARGGIGIAAMLVRQLQPHQKPAEALPNQGVHFDRSGRR